MQILHNTKGVIIPIIGKVEFMINRILRIDNQRDHTNIYIYGELGTSDFSIPVVDVTGEINNSIDLFINNSMWVNEPNYKDMNHCFLNGFKNHLINNLKFTKSSLESLRISHFYCEGSFYEITEIFNNSFISLGKIHFRIPTKRDDPEFQEFMYQCDPYVMWSRGINPTHDGGI